jgi:hypothetical protein
MGRFIDAGRARTSRRALLLTSIGLVIAGSVSVAAVVRAAPAHRTVAAHASVASANIPLAGCTTSPCKFTLGVNPGLTPGHPFACPAIQHATATISITNRFKTGALNDTMTLTAAGLPPNTGFDLFLVQHSAFDSGFTTFGFGWYQSDVHSSSTGHATVKVIGIFDKETFIVNPSSSTPVHTFNVGFWFDSPTTQAAKCGTAAPAPTPFNGEQDAGLLAMITTGAPLGKVN